MSRVNSISAIFSSLFSTSRLAVLFVIIAMSGCAEQVHVDSKSKQTSFQGSHVIRYDLPADGVLIKFSKDASGDNTSAKSLRSRVLQESGVKDSANFTALVSGLVLAKVSSETLQYTVQSLALNPLVEYAEPNYLVTRAAVPNDPDFAQLWALNNTGQTGGKIGADIKATQAWDVQTGSNIVIAVIDSGVDYTHPDLVDNMWVNSGEIPGNGIDDDKNGYVDDVRGWNFIDNNNDPMDLNNHGTHIAGIIAAKGDNNQGIVGVNWRAKIMPLRFMDASGTGSTASAIQAIEYAVANGAQISNASWGSGGYSQALYDVINAAASSRHIVVTAAGNSGTNNDLVPLYPSGFALANILSVAASDDNDQLATFSNFGVKTVDLAAPGTRILSTVRDGRYAMLSGSSMAAPMVAGVASLLLAQEPALTASDVVNRIIGSTDTMPALNGRVAAGGRLNAFNALTGKTTTPPAVVTPIPVTTPPLTVLTVAPNAADLRVGESMQFTVTGGSGNYSWRVISSNGGLVQAEFSAPGLLLAKAEGAVQIVADDLDNLVSSNTVNIQISPMEILPSNLTQLNVGQQVNLELLGGSGNFSWDVVDPASGLPLSGVASLAISADSRSAQLTVISAGNFAVKVVDLVVAAVTKSAAIQALAVAPAVTPLSIAIPASVTLNIGDSLPLTVTGGTAPFQWQSSDSARVSVGLSNGIVQAKTYTLPGIRVTISVTDSQGQSDSISLTVNPAALVINASRTALIVGDSYQISVSGGIAPYNWTSANVSLIGVTTNSSNSSQATVSALLTSAGQKVGVTVYDSVGTNVSIAFTSAVAPLTIATDGAVIWKGNNANSVAMIAEGGVAPYTWSEIVNGTRYLDVNAQTGVMTARESAGVATISVKDALGTITVGSVEVRKVAITGLPGSVSLTTNSSGTVLSAATSGVLVVGVKPLSSIAVVDSATGNATSAAIISLNSDGSYTFTARAAGSVRVKVTDANGNNGQSSTISITVTSSCFGHDC